MRTKEHHSHTPPPHPRWKGAGLPLTRAAPRGPTLESPLRVGGSPGRKVEKSGSLNRMGKSADSRLLRFSSPRLPQSAPSLRIPPGQTVGRDFCLGFKKKKKRERKKKKRGLAILHIPLPRPAPPSLNSQPRNKTIFSKTGYLKGGGGTAKLNWGQTGTNSSTRGEEASAQARAWRDRWRPGWAPPRPRRGRGHGQGQPGGRDGPAGPAPPPRGRLAAHDAPLLRGLGFPGWHRASRATCWGAETPILGPAGATGAEAAASSPGARLLFSGEEVGWGRSAEGQKGRPGEPAARAPGSARGRGGGHTWGKRA